MSKSLYIATSEAHSGKSAIALGITEMLVQNISKIGYFRPVINTNVSADKRDNDIELICDHFKLDIPYGDTYAYTLREAEEFVHQGKLSELIDGILNKYTNMVDKYDFVLCEGTDFAGIASAFEFDINAEIARNLNAPVLLVANGNRTNIDDIISSVKLSLEAFEEKDCHVMATIVNRVAAHRQKELEQLFQAKINRPDKLLFTIPENEILNSPVMSEVAQKLDAEVLYGSSLMNRQVHNYKIAAAQLDTFLSVLQDGCLIITPGDRADILLGVLLAVNSKAYSDIAGIVLTNGIKPDGAVDKLIRELPAIVPIISVPEDTYRTTQKINSLHPRISKGFNRKITVALSLFEKHIDTNMFFEKLSATKSDIITPKMFEYYLIQRSKANRQHIVLPEGEEDRILQAAEILTHRSVVDLTLLGRKNKIMDKIKLQGLKLDKINVIEPTKSPQFEEYAQAYYELRKDKGITPEIASNLMTDVSYFGTMMVHRGHADGMVSGSVNTTQHTLRPALQFIRTKPGFSIVSSVFFMCLKDRVLVYGDCAVNPNPSAEQLAEIAITSAQTAATFGIEPRVAMLSYSTGSSGKGEDVDKVREATRIAKERAPELLIEGPIQYDAAISPDVAKTKMPDSAVAGRATIFIFPDLNTGNNTYKAVQRSAGAVAIGPVMQGLKKRSMISVVDAP